MLSLETTNFGQVEYEESAIIEFPAGLPAFEDERRFLLIETPEVAPVRFMQSLARPDLVFITLPLTSVMADYQLTMSREDRRLLQLEETDVAPEHLLCLTIVTLPGNAEPTANLLAPVVIHPARRVGIQVIQAESGYSHQHPLPARECPC